jgi:hypothetical protein
VNVMYLGSLRCGTNDQLPCGTGVMRWLCHCLSRGILVGPTCQVSVVVGPTWLRWTNEVLTRDTDMLRWPNEVMRRDTLSLSTLILCVYV